MSVQFDTPANRIIASQAPKNQFRIDPTLPDIAFLRQLAIQGRLTYDIGTVNNTTADAFTITPASGSTYFTYKMIMSARVANVTFTARNDGTDRIVYAMESGGLDNVQYLDSLVGDGIKTYTVNVATGVNGAGRVTLLGWLENTSRIRDVTI